MAPSFDLTQPTSNVAPVSNDDPLPALAAPAVEEEGPPPRPAENTFVSQYTDAPYQEVVVVGMLVNSEGEVIDSKLVIPSRYALKDLGLVLASKQQRVTGIKPALMPGEVRWVEIRLSYANQGQPIPNDNVLP